MRSGQALPELSDPVWRGVASNYQGIYTASRALLDAIPAMATHELAPNAAKFGALSNDRGQVAISWHMGSVNPPVLTLKWQEPGGPPVDAPQRRGFGSRLIEGNVAVDLQGDAKLEYCSEGVVCTITTRIDAINPRRTFNQSKNK